MGECKHVFFHNFSEDSPEKLVIFPEQTLSEPLKETNKQEFGEMLNGMPSGVFVGNGFIRSERWMNTRGSLNGNGSLFQHFSIQRASHKNVARRNG